MDFEERKRLGNKLPMQSSYVSQVRRGTNYQRGNFSQRGRGSYNIRGNNVRYGNYGQNFRPNFGNRQGNMKYNNQQRNLNG